MQFFFIKVLYKTLHSDCQWLMIKEHDTFSHLNKCIFMHRIREVCFMDNSVIINGFIHQLLQNEIATDAECLDILHTYFKLPLYTIAAFAPDTKTILGSYQRDVISFIPGYASGCRNCIVWFYRTENHELLLIF